MGLNPATGQNDDNLAQFGLVGRGRLKTDVIRYPNVPVPAFPGDTNKLLDTALETKPELFRRDVAANTQAALIGNQTFNERISAAYLMGTVDIGRLNVLAGVRI